MLTRESHGVAVILLRELEGFDAPHRKQAGMVGIVGIARVSKARSGFQIRDVVSGEYNKIAMNTTNTLNQNCLAVMIRNLLRSVLVTANDEG